jgi:hypothetical protein
MIDPDQLPGGPFSLKVVLSEGRSLSASGLPLIVLAFDLCDWAECMPRVDIALIKKMEPTPTRIKRSSLLASDKELFS